MDHGADMRVRPVESGHNPTADHAAIFIICLWKHDDVLGHAAAGDGITPAQIGPQLLTQLRANLQSLSPHSGVSIVLTAEDVPLPADTASSLALVVNELVTNALEHAFPLGAGGTITIAFAAGKRFHTLSVSDNGCGFDPSAPRKSLGLRIVDSTVRDRLHGKLTILSDERGTRASFDFKTE